MSIVEAAISLIELHAILVVETVWLVGIPETNNQIDVHNLSGFGSSNPLEGAFNITVAGSNPNVILAHPWKRAHNEVILGLRGDGDKVAWKPVVRLHGGSSQSTVEIDGGGNELVVVSVGREQDRGGVCEVKRIKVQSERIEQAHA